MKVKYLIIGAGLSGLAFAGHIDDSDYVVLEKENIPGGLCRTIKRNGYTWDYAGHFFHFKDEESKAFFEPVLNGEKCVSQKKNTKIFFKGRYIDYPFQKNIHQLGKDDFIDCLYHLYFREEKKEYKSFKDMLTGKFGEGICNRFLIPYNEKLYACDLNTLDKDAMGRFFPYADFSDIIRNMKNGDNTSYNDTFIYPVGGAEAVINHLLTKVREENIRLGETVQKIDIEKKYAITNTDIYEYEYLINTAPLNNFLDLINGFKSSELSWNKVLVFNIGFDKPSIDKTIHWIYYPEPNTNFYRVGFYNNILNEDRLSVYVEIGFASNENIDVQEQFMRTLQNLKLCGITDSHEVIDYEAIIMNPAYVHISNKSKLLLSKIKDVFNRNDVYTMGRYGGWTYCSMEDCFIEARELANGFNKR